MAVGTGVRGVGWPVRVGVQAAARTTNGVPLMISTVGVNPGHTAKMPTTFGVTVGVAIGVEAVGVVAKPKSLPPQPASSATATAIDRVRIISQHATALP